MSLDKDQDNLRNYFRNNDHVKIKELDNICQKQFRETTNDTSCAHSQHKLEEDEPAKALVTPRLECRLKQHFSPATPEDDSYFMHQCKFY